MSSGKRLTNEEVLKRIRKKCLEKDIEFIGFNNDENFYKNNKTYLKLKCNKCGNIWNTTSYEKFMSGRGCPNCSKTKKITEKEAVKRILKKCEEKNYEFIGFVSGKFNNIGEKLTGAKNVVKYGIQQHLIIWLIKKETLILVVGKIQFQCQ